MQMGADGDGKGRERRTQDTTAPMLAVVLWLVVVGRLFFGYGW